MKEEWLSDPQRWNHYAYVRNNPLRYVDPNGEDLVIYFYYGKDLTREQRKYLDDSMKQIQAAISAKFHQTGVKNVQFQPGTLTDSQVKALRKDAPTGVVTLNFVNKSFGGHPLGGTLGKTDAAISAVSLNNTIGSSLMTPAAADDATKTLRLGEVGAHGLGHAVGFESNWLINALTAGGADFVRSNLMDENQGLPTKPKSFDTTSDKNKRVIQEINRVGDNTPNQ